MKTVPGDRDSSSHAPTWEDDVPCLGNQRKVVELECSWWGGGGVGGQFREMVKLRWDKALQGA